MKIQVVTISLLTLNIYFQNAKLLARAEEAPDLYSPAGDVLRLNSTSFIPTVFHQNKNITYMVQFYNTFCGHCQMFAPVYKDLASRMKNWTSVVRIAGVDCSKDENLITCSENKIEGYPTIFIFPPNARVQEPKDKPLNLRSLNIDWTVDDIEESVVDYVANLSVTRQEYPLVVDALKPIDSTELKDIKRIYSLEAEKDKAVDDQQGLQDLMFVVEPETSYLGRKLILEFHRIHHKLELRRILLTNKELLKSIMQQDEFFKLEENQPVLLRMNDDDNIAQVLVRGESKNILPTSQEHERMDFIYNRFRMFFEHFYSVELREMYSDLKTNSQVEKVFDINEMMNKNKNDTQLDFQDLLQIEPVKTKRVLAIDLLKGISYMITHEIQIKGDQTPEEYNTVRNLLTILKKYLPLDKWDTNLSKFIDELRTRLDNNRSLFDKNGITAQEMRDILKISGAEMIRSKYSKEKWVSCMESDKQHKGYTCSLWLLFHSLTAGEYVKAAPVRSKPTLVLFTMRDYITKFLGCTVCSSNFEKETESLAQSLNSRNSSVLWLWSTHNHINQRLNNERIESNRKPLVEVIFPAKHLCEECLLTDANEIGRDGKTVEDIEWNMSNVFSYLLDIYRPDHVITPAEMVALLAKKLKYDVVEVSTHGGRRRISTAGNDMNQSEKWNIMSTSDISLCLFLYVACVVIVAVVCVALNPKLATWKRFKTK